MRRSRSRSGHCAGTLVSMITSLGRGQAAAQNLKITYDFTIS